MAAGPPKIGTRIILSGHIGTIKFTGSVHGTIGIWLGIEWDDPRRGKHDGAKDGVQYFTCAWVSFGQVVHSSHPFPVSIGSPTLDHSFGRHPLSNMEHPSHKLLFRDMWRISADPETKNLSSLVLPMGPLRSRP